MIDNPAGDIQAALGGKFVPNIMVAQNIVERNIELGPEPGQIFRGQIAAADYQIEGIGFNGAAGADKVGHNDV
jgi:hypothetical protein